VKIKSTWLFLLFLLQGAPALRAESQDMKKLSKIEASYCRAMRRQGVNLARSFIESENQSCTGFIEKTDSIGQQYFEQVRAIETTDYSQECLLDGFRNGGLSLIEEASLACGDALNGAALFARSLAYARAYLTTDRAQWKVLSLTGAPYLPGTSADEDFVVRPAYADEWMDKLMSSTKAGFSFGTLLGQKDRLAGKSASILNVADTGYSLAQALGRSVGRTISMESCLVADSYLADFPEAYQADFAKGLAETSAAVCERGDKI
jgi:hypothetical protein